MLVGIGEISFAKYEFLVAPYSTEAEISVERIHTIKDKVDVKWKTSPNLGLNGLLKFDSNDTEKIIYLDLLNVTNNQSIQIELLQPTNDYQLGKNQFAKISHVCK